MEGWELMKIRGIPVRVHPSWFLILMLFTYSAQAQINKVAVDALPVWFSWGLGLLTALLLFVSVLLHELGHSFVALHEGIKVRSITLFLLGGVARVERECSNPMAALRVAAAGPLVSLVLAMVFLRTVQSASMVSPLLANLVGQLGVLNLVLALFNLLPGLPLDGGLILKALVWKCTGSQSKGTQVATATGRCLSISAIVLGVWLCLRGGGFSGLWLVMIGWFGLASSRSQSQMLSLQKVLTEQCVGDSLAGRLRVLEADQTLRSLSQLRLLENDASHLPEWVLICRSGRWIGYITEKPLKEQPVQQWDKQQVGEHVQPLSDLPSIGQKAPLWKAVEELEKSQEGKLLVFNLAGLPSGTLDRISLGEIVLKHLGIKLPAPLIEAAKAQNTYPLGMALPRVVASMVTSGVVDQVD